MSSQTDHKLELESQFILRLPPSKAEALRQAIRGGEPLSKRLSVKFDSEIRQGYIKFDNSVMPGRLYDLPTIIESYKTLDRKNFYKTADISQVLICKEEDELDSSCLYDKDEDSMRAKYDKLFSSVGGVGRKEFLYPHGITPPLKNVRKRRFRKTLKKKYVDFTEIEKEVKRLFKFDCEAIDSRYEIVEENKMDKVQTTQFNTENAPSPLSGGPMDIQSAENSQNFGYQELFGEDSSSSDESDDDDDDDDEKDDDLEMEVENDEDNVDDEEQEDMVSVAQPVEQSVPVADNAAEVEAASDLIAQKDDSEEKRQELHKELHKIRERIQNQENEMQGLDNQALRMRLQPVLDSLHEQENEIKSKLEELNGYM